MPLSISSDVLDDRESYFKFNLDAISLFSLLRLEEQGFHRATYQFAYDTMRRTTDDHPNAYFHLIDRALNSRDSKRDAAAIELLRERLQRPRRDAFVDLRGVFAACGPDRACNRIPLPQQVRTDFLWQRSPFLLFGGGEGRIEGPGIDFILPYWMARYYGVL